MLGVLIRTPGAVRGYFVYSFVLPPLTMLLAELNDWWEGRPARLDFNYAQGPLYEGDVSGTEWDTSRSPARLASAASGGRPLPDPQSEVK